MQKENQERQLRLHEEARKHNEVLNSRKLLRNEEIAQLKSIQQNHMDELKAREKECEELRSQSTQLQQKRADIEEEFGKFTEHIRKRNETQSAPSFNLRRIKMLLRQRSDAVRNHLKHDIDLLNRLNIDDRVDQQSIDLLREKFEMQYDLEIQKQSMIEAMYESEAKVALVKQQEIWEKESQAREKLLKGLIGEHMQQIDSAITHNQKRREELDVIRETHRQAINSTIERITDLAKEQKSDDQEVVVDAVNLPQPSAATNRVVNSLNVVGNAMENVTIGESATRPKFGRKKIAWT